MKKIILLMAVLLATGCNSNAQKNSQKEETAKKPEFAITKSDAEWKKELTDAEYRVLRKAETERPHSSELNEIEEDGIFVCAACGNELYETKHKFESGTGWPSFDRAIEGGVSYGSDRKIGYPRDEVHCTECGGHLGHVFNDGPRETTGKRHCINGIAMNFIPENE